MKIGPFLIRRLINKCTSDGIPFIVLTCDIENEKLATVNPKSHTIVYQNFTDRFHGNITGYMYNLIGYHHDILVTGNHKMYIQNVERNTHKVHDWMFESISQLHDGFNILNVINPKKKIYIRYYFKKMD